MKVILRTLARANLRWAAADLARADRLRQDRDDAMDAAEAHLRIAQRYAGRADLSAVWSDVRLELDAVDRRAWVRFGAACLFAGIIWALLLAR